MVAETVLETAIVVTVKAADEDPAGTVTVAGTVALALSDDRLTTIPPGPAAPVRVTVPIEELLPMTVVGERLTEDRLAGLIVNVDVWVLEPCVAVIVAVVTLETAVVLTVTVAVVAPAITVIELWTVALALFEERFTTVPPVGAGPLIVTVPVDAAPP